MIKDVTIDIKRDTLPTAEDGFGVPLILGTSKDHDYTEYITPDAVAEDFGESDEEKKIAELMFSQDPRPGRIAIRSVDTVDVNALKDELDELIKEDDDWYFLTCTERGTSDIKELASWAKDNGKMYVATTDDDDVKTSGGELADLDNENTVLIYHDNLDTNVAEGFVGKVAPKDPGSLTWKFKQVAGVDEPADVDENDVKQIHDNNINTYIKKMGQLQTSEGLTTAGEFADVIRGQHYVEARLHERIQRLFFQQDKIPFTNQGISQVVSEVEAVMQEATSMGIIATDEDGNGLFEVDAPTRAEVSEDKRKERTLPDVKFEFELAGAVHELKIRGVIRV